MIYNTKLFWEAHTPIFLLDVSFDTYSNSRICHGSVVLASELSVWRYKGSAPAWATLGKHGSAICMDALTVCLLLPPCPSRLTNSKVTISHSHLGDIYLYLTFKFASKS